MARRRRVEQPVTFIRRLLVGAVAGAAGTTALNAATFVDMAARARPASDLPQQAVDVLASLGLDVRQQRWQRRLQMIGESDADHVARIARRLCVGPERHAEVRRLLEETPPPDAREVTTLWWEPTGG